ncbi:MAG: Glutamyl-tRNA(Gln) amidotransferase subunit A [Fimbriimonadaceae bacterium]|nr:Glutamyl-tRNA(Gln) amidotransferase subunit A [Fimbriimonadaceae bacterium]
MQRLGSVGKDYRVAIQLTPDLARQQAKAADARLSAGKKLGPLDGIPFGVKDLLATKGIPTRWGSPGHADQVFDYDATAVERLQKAGSVLVAKLAMIELAGGGNYDVAHASDVGATACAWDKQRWAGGSSSGSGSATALGCVPYSLGSETSGSITCPSAFNGATGFRATYGRVSRHGAMALCWTLDKIGPIGRSAEDCAEVLKVIAGHDPKDPSTLTERLDLRMAAKKPRIGLLKENFSGAQASACEKAYQDALAVFKKLGWETVDVSYPSMPYGLAVGIIVDAEGASAHEHFIRSDRLKHLADINQVAGFAASLDTKAVDYLWAMRLRVEALKANAIWDKCDAIFTPVFYHAAPAIDKPFSETFRNMGGDGGPANLLGWPTVALPIGFENGAPLGGQFIGPAYGEGTSYQLARTFQRETDHHLKRPIP